VVEREAREWEEVEKEVEEDDGDGRVRLGVVQRSRRC